MGGKDKDKDKNIHKEHRQRVKKRFLREGLDSFEDHQVLEMLLFYTYSMRDTNEIAHRMINEYGTLHNLFEADTLDISKRCKVTENVAILVSMIPSLARRYFLGKWDKKDIFDSSLKAGNFSIALATGRKVESFFLICLNNKRGLIHAEKMFEGTIDETPVYPREIVETALKHQAASVILTHNHPSGILAPSRSDIEATKKIISALETINVEVIDHIIVAGDKYYSFSEKKTLPLWY